MNHQKLNNLQLLNDNLFDLFDEVKNGKIDIEKANAMIGISNTIINNAKVQLQGIKQFHELGYEPNATSNSTVKKLVGDVYDRKFQFAISIGHQNVSDAVAKLGKEQFEALFAKSQNAL